MNIKSKVEMLEQRNRDLCEIIGSELRSEKEIELLRKHTKYHADIYDFKYDHDWDRALEAARNLVSICEEVLKMRAH